LVDQDGDVPPDGVAQIGAERAALSGILEIAGEEYEAPGIGVAKEAGLIGSQVGAKTAIDDCLGAHIQFATVGMQGTLRAERAEQAAREAASVSKLEARRR